MKVKAQNNKNTIVFFNVKVLKVDNNNKLIALESKRESVSFKTPLEFIEISDANIHNIALSCPTYETGKPDVLKVKDIIGNTWYISKDRIRNIKYRKENNNIYINFEFKRKTMYLVSKLELNE